jgi:hypothetical protein
MHSTAARDRQYCEQCTYAVHYNVSQRPVTTPAAAAAPAATAQCGSAGQQQR